MSALLGTAWHVAQCRRRRAVAVAAGEVMACRPAAGTAKAVVAVAAVDRSGSGLLKATTGEGAPPS